MKQRRSEELPQGDSKKKKSKLGTFFNILVPVICIGVFGYAAYNFWHIQDSYNVAVKEYKQLEQFVQVRDLTEGAGSESGFPDVEIDFDSLHDINPDVVGWILIPALDLSYPVMQGTDNDYYLHHTLEGTENASGSIFLDSESRPDLEDRNTFCYGHNMRNLSMFGSLKRFRQEEGLCDSDPYFYLFTPGNGYKYHIFAYYVTKVGSQTYFNMYTDEQYDEYIEYVDSVSEYENGRLVDLSDRERLVTLSTCSGSHSTNRMIVQGVLCSRYTIE